MRGASGVRIQRRFAIHQKPVPMITFRQPDLNEPPAVLLLSHEDGVPMIKIACQLDDLRLGCGALEIHRLDIVGCGTKPVIGFIVHHIYKIDFLIGTFFPWLMRFRFASFAVPQNQPAAERTTWAGDGWSPKSSEFRVRFLSRELCDRSAGHASVGA